MNDLVLQFLFMEALMNEKNPSALYQVKPLNDEK